MADRAETTFPPIQSLADLREAVLERNPHRLPIWRFRLSPEIIMSMQPQPCVLISERAKALGAKQHTVKFRCEAILVDGGAGADDLDHRPDGPHNYWRTNFTVQDGSRFHWEISWGASRWKRNACIEGVFRLKREIASAFVSGRFNAFSPDLMLRPACMVCGRPLTDPASMARWIGPECWGSGALLVPSLFTAEECE